MKKLVQSLPLVFLVANILFAQNNYYTIEKPQISGGAEYNLMLQKAVKEGTIHNYIYKGPYSPPVPNAPSAITIFDGLNFDDNATLNSGSLFIPPDPSAAAGLDRVIAVENVMIEARTKTGTLIFSAALNNFFSSLTPATTLFDPKVIYDQYEGRFIVISLEQIEGGGNPSTGNISRILLAVSKTSTPATATSSDWYYFAINSKILISGTEYWADYPGLAIDEEAVYVTTNMFGFNNAAGFANRLWIIDKGVSSGFYFDGTASFSENDPIPSGSFFEGTNQPAHVFGASGVATGTGTFLILYSGLSGGGNESLQVIRVDDPLGTPSFTGQFVSVGNMDNTTASLPDAPQKNSSTKIATNDRRTLNAVWRNNALWVTTTVVPPSGSDAGEATAHWFKLNTTILSSITVSDQGDIGGEDIATNAYTFFPSIAVNSSGDMVVGFSVSAQSMFPSFYYTGRLSIDAAGTTITPVVVRAGLDFYVRIFGSSGNRWGDYSGASVDPSDDQTFWVFNEYALTQGTPSGTGQGRWGTAFGKIPISELPVELSSFTFSLTNNGVKLNWVTQTEVNNYGFDIERTQFNRKDTLWTKLVFIGGHGNSNSPKQYSFTDNSAKYGNYAYRLKQIDNDGTYEYSDKIEVNAGVIPGEFVLEQNYPNPFNPSTKIKFAVNESTKATLKIYDILGNEIVTLFNEITKAGKVYELEFKASGLPSGIYIYGLMTETKSEIRKMILLK